MNMNSGECYVSNGFQCEPYPVFDDENRIRRAIEAVRVGYSTTTYLKVRKSQRLPPSNFGLWHFCDMAAMNLQSSALSGRDRCCWRFGTPNLNLTQLNTGHGELWPM